MNFHDGKTYLVFHGKELSQTLTNNQQRNQNNIWSADLWELQAANNYVSLEVNPSLLSQDSDLEMTALAYALITVLWEPKSEDKVKPSLDSWPTETVTWYVFLLGNKCMIILLHIMDN